MTEGYNDDSISFLKNCSREDIHKIQKDLSDSSSNDQLNVHRRMTLAEFTGLNNSNNKIKQASTPVSPSIQKSTSNLFTKSPKLAHMSRRTSHLLEIINDRGRRASMGVLQKMHIGSKSSTNSRRNSTEANQQDQHSFFHLTETVSEQEKAFLNHLDMTNEPCAVSKLQQRMRNLQKTLETTLLSLPTQSDQQLQELQSTKACMMEELCEMMSGFKSLFRNGTKMINNHSSVNPKHFQKHMLILDRCITLCEKIGLNLEKIMKYSGNIFTAQLIYSRTEELLEAIDVILTETGKVDRHELPEVIVRNSKMIGEALNQFSLFVSGL
uniref:Protein kinase domain-containing protein n=1 Tax=Parastrongyloides trichosuri TaxID=131310 RepID=A0A0N4Z750_PARTI